ncbi:glycosyltransferase family 2 protein [Phaeacidiphilus oryzae]|uniref:glycosyltransferase family 2 protein n=1 Tax=Phaeacidiphilus oryzae TaxID=348818 RepID=UPI000A04D9AB|nr:glycosyltransferase family 2 protein [Phaeacidiphilus oryzae]
MPAPIEPADLAPAPATAPADSVAPARVAVLVVSWNSATVLPGFLAALPEGMAGLDWRLVVADNDSADGSAELVRRLAPEAVVVRTGRNAGYAAGINAALDAAERPPGGLDAVLVCNPDIRMAPGCGAALVGALGPGVGITAPLLREADGRTLVHSLRREPSLGRALGEALIGNRRAGRFPRWGELVTDPAAYTRRGRADWATGALLAISRDCLDACGRWDESFFLYSEETEYCLRARDAGYATVFEPAASARHLGGESRTSPRLWTLLTLNRVLLYGRRHGPAATTAFRGAVLLRELSRALLGRAPSRAAATALLGLHHLGARRLSPPAASR